jgi:hypothetical protein
MAFTYFAELGIRHDGRFHLWPAQRTLSTAYSITFIAMLKIATAMWRALGETVGRQRWIAIAIGMVGCW